MSRQRVGEIGGQPVEAVTLTGASGMRAKILSFGATLADLSLETAQGPQSVVLGHAALSGYADNPAYLGVTAGRYANRIANGRFSLDGARIEVDRNERARQHLHGGAPGISHRHWQIIGQTDTMVSLQLTSPAGDNGYPGNAVITCIYAVLEPGTLAVTYSAICDAVTVMNLAHHSYFTLAPGSDIRDHSMQIEADFYTPVDADLIPTGEIRRVAGTPFDFRELRTLHQPPTTPYDINFVLRKPLGVFGPCVTLVGPDGKLRLTVATDAPGVQVYDGYGLGAPHGAYAGIALEPQFFPDSPNQPHFPSARLAPGAVYRQRTEYRFTVG
jgi:aldose 1-epimerase